MEDDEIIAGMGGIFFVALIIVSILWYRDHKDLTETIKVKEETLSRAISLISQCRDNQNQLNRNIEGAKSAEGDTYYNMRQALEELETIPVNYDYSSNDPLDIR